MTLETSLKSRLFDSPELKKVEERLERFANSQYKETAELTTPFLIGRGKKLRPLLTILCSTFYKPFDDNNIDIAIAGELIHTASLIHDDIVDEAKARRGVPTINHKRGNQMAVLSGDYLFAKAFELLAPYNSSKILKTMTTAVREMSQGEICQLQNLYNTEVTREDYFDYIYKKTASLISACCEAGAIIGEAPIDKIKIIRNFGIHLGLAFQIIDDLLDFTAKPLNVGKPTKKDLGQGNITIPIIYLFETSKDGEKVKEIINNRELTRENLEYITSLLYSNGAISYTYSLAKEEIKKAIICLEEMPDVEVKKTLSRLTYFISERKE
ncbi:polyprenyl synthetase family protein [Natranaerofaba carboxydovora]|uniref:polyprenyl synthetase family protein n=1 Tax=Natranaerofaba carboxydovora TaxID=2742683 RepID=UPI001F1427C7|nr:polyprenyl synthetase family protein [Natranaerofaba carboxydovora]UMZ73183.1 Octaprenyl diphosphate synthase [Natranaerofaba carboxydovora]